MLGVGFVPHHANQQQRNEDAAQTVHGKNHQGEDRVAKAGELLTAKGDNGHEDGDDHRHELRGFVLLSPFGLDVVGNGRCTRQHLAVGGGHGGGEDGCEDHAGEEGIEHFHCQQRQSVLSLRSVKVEENSTAGQPDDEHERNEGCLPDEEPDGRLFAVLVVFERHHSRNHLRLACHAEAAEEEGTDP